MSHLVGKGNFIDGDFISARGEEISSLNPAQNFETVFTTHSDIKSVDQAVEAANKAFTQWFGLPQGHRNSHLLRLKDAFVRHEADMARAISLEMGKPLSESVVEAKNLSARIELTIKYGLTRVATEKPAGLMGEARYHAQGPVAVLGPYNFPAHLLNAHVIPALLTGNTVVVKPSEVCPWVGELYAQCVKEAQLPNGVFNLIQGKGDVGKALAIHPRIRAVLFTGSYATGRTLKELLLDQPHKILALEMGGKNIAVVLEDADLFQALSEITQGAFLTTGQRCTATSRVFLHRSIADRMTESLVRVTKTLKPSDPFEPTCAFGPLATKQSLNRYLRLLESASECGAETILAGETFDGGAYVTPSIHSLRKNADLRGSYLNEELFGPNMCIEIIDSLDEAISRTNESVYGLSNAIFTSSQAAFDQFYRETFSGVLNFNRSTNGALGQLPFGGVGKSGNQRAAGIDAVRYTTFPVAINYLPYAETEPVVTFKSALSAEHDSLELPVEALSVRHAAERFLSLRGFQILDAKGPQLFVSMAQLSSLFWKGASLDGPKLVELLEPMAKVDGNALCITLSKDLTTCERVIHNIFRALSDENATQLSKLPSPQVHVPLNAVLPQSDAMLTRLYKDNFVPKEKKTPVIDLHRSKGPYLCSIDEDPLAIFDAASQIASLGVGFQSGLFLNALDAGNLTEAVVANPENDEAKDRYSKFLLDHAWTGLKHATFTSSGAEANEKAFDLCRLNGQKGKRVIAFEGSFHGRTLMALQATFNPQKRGLFEFAGYEATFVPFPSWKDPKVQPQFSDAWIKQWHDLKIPNAPIEDELLSREIASLTRLKEEIEEGDVACVIVEPMQCEGGDNYGTSRFFNALRALTRALKVPLVFDEVQTGFGLLGPFFAHSAFNLRDAKGKTDGPDCVTLAKKAQLGVVLSAWPDTRPQPCHLLQVERGLLQAEAMSDFSIVDLHDDVILRLEALKQQYPEMIFSPRAKGYAFAFDLPTARLANEIISQRFYRGYMVYIAGEKTMRFRLNMKTHPSELDQLFAGIRRSFDDVRAHVADQPSFSFEQAALNYVSPAWVPYVTRKADRIPLAGVSIERLTLAAFDKHEADIARLEAEAYEPGRRDTMEYLRGFVAQDDGLALFMLDMNQMVIGYAIGGPLENSDADGPKDDPMRGKNNTFYSTNVLIAPHLRGHGLGLRLKKAQIDGVRAMKDQSGKPRYEFMCGRNRLDFTAEMGAINRLFGAYTVKVYEQQYGDEDGRALYYRVPLRRPTLSLPRPQSTQMLDWSLSIQSPFGPCPEKIFDDLQNGIFTGAIGTKLTLSNWVTPEFVRYAELLRQLAPKACKHAYFTSGRDEVNDKAVRCLRVARPEGQIMIGLRGQFFGTTTAVSRSLTEPSSYEQPFSWFDWPLVPHPSKEGTQVTIEAITSLIKKNSPEKILGIAVELVGEKTGQTLPDDFLDALNALREKTGVPLVFSETASALGRNGRSLFFSDAQQVKPNLVPWYTGAQLGHLFADDQYYVAKPLTLISTWDGDEVSIMRTYRHLLLAREALGLGLSKVFEDALLGAGLSDVVRGQGLWRAVEFHNEAHSQDFLSKTKASGLLLKKGFDHRVMITPHLGSTVEELKRGAIILKEAL